MSEQEDLCVLMEVGCFGDMPVDPTAVKAKKKKTLEQSFDEQKEYFIKEAEDKANSISLLTVLS